MYCNKNWMNVVSLEGVKMSIYILDHCSPWLTEATDLQISGDNCRNDVSSGVEMTGKKSLWPVDIFPDTLFCGLCPLF